jgi:hypothetical protein
MESNLSRTSRLLPGVVFLAYLSGTAILYFVGPWTYPMPDGIVRLVAFLVAVHAAFVLGYFRGAWVVPRPARLPVSINSVVLAAAAVELLLLFPTSALNTGRWIPDPFAAARDLGAAYANSLSVREGTTPYVNYLRMFFAPLLAAALPLALFYWHDLRVLTRVVFALSVVGVLALFVAMGANAGVGHWLGLFPWFILAAHFSGRQLISRRTTIAAGVILTVSIVLLAVLFTGTMVQRQGSFASAGYLPGIDAHIGPTATLRVNPVSGRLESPYADRPSARIGFDGLAGYLTQGYFAVYLSLHQPFVPCYGVGNSVFVQRQVARLTGSDDILRCPYPVRLENRGWFATRYWATIYPWIASDVTFPGTVIIVYLIGWATAMVWVDAVGGRNPYAVALLGQFLLMLYYFPAHNKIMHSGEGVIAFFVLMGAWLATRGRTSTAG